jgi:hypothetical protein
VKTPASQQPPTIDHHRKTPLPITTVKLLRELLVLAENNPSLPAVNI